VQWRSSARLHSVETRINLADPDFEPTDKQLRQLSKSAFADVAEQNRIRLEKLRQDIKIERALVLERLKKTA
jgi:hypothetical protein